MAKKTNGSPEPPTPQEPVRIEIEFDGEQFSFRGPIHNTVLCLGMLETAKARIVSQMTKAELRQAAEKSRIVRPDVGINPRLRREK